MNRIMNIEKEATTVGNGSTSRTRGDSGVINCESGVVRVNRENRVKGTVFGDTGQEGSRFGLLQAQNSGRERVKEYCDIVKLGSKRVAIPANEFVYGGGGGGGPGVILVAAGL
jgi:hypothetical protein